MERSKFKERMKQYKKAREENPGLKYWELKGIPKYDEGIRSVATDEQTLRRNIQRVLNTTPEGDVNPFYSSLDNTYGTVQLPEVVVTAPYTRKASLAQQAREGVEAYHRAGRKAAPVLAALPLTAAGFAAASTLGWSNTMNLLDVASNPTDPMSYVGNLSATDRIFKALGKAKGEVVDASDKYSILRQRLRNQNVDTDYLSDDDLERLLQIRKDAIHSAAIKENIKQYGLVD